MAANELLIEIGLEELPASFVEPAMASLAGLLVKELDGARIAHGQVKTYGTPRRVAAFFQDVADRGEDIRETVSGPPKRAAVDGEGNPTKAGMGFARSQGVEFGDLKVIETAKGEYMAVDKLLPGRSLAEVISDKLPGLLAAMPFRKSMRWGDSDFRFARPIHWLVVLHGADVIGVEVAGIASGRATRGHRFHAPEPIELAAPSDYLDALRQARVMADPAERKEVVRTEAQAAARAEGGLILEDEDLVAINANLVEWPSAVCGRFDDEFMKVPDAVLITAMKEHQKYFAVVDENGGLLPRFVAINNTLARDPNVVRQGHQRVIRARLADAAFFMVEDGKQSLDNRVDDLKDIVYHKLLGTSHEKMERFTALADWLAQRLAPQSAQDAGQAARLCKADLVSLMVGEFPSLQGVVGRAYALNQGVSGPVALAIAEHYLPTGPDSPLPSGEAGALVGLGDRLDTIAGMFAINKPPTGGADPFALRRAALGVLRILIDRKWNPGLSAAIDQALDNIPAGTFKIDRAEAKAKVVEFFHGRLANMLTGRGFAADVVEAVLAAHLDDPAGCLARVEALQAFRDSEEFEAGAIAFKRLFNILKGQSVAGAADAGLFEQEEEKALHQAAADLSDAVRAAAAKGDFSAVLKNLTSLRPVVDSFFDAVMVMAEDEKLKENRLALVAEVAGLFRLVADFARLQTG